MKIYPNIVKQVQGEKEPKLTTLEAFLRGLALLVAFISVFAFFIKILFY